MADDTPSVEAVTAMLREAQAEIAALKRTLAAVRADRDYWHSQAHLLATELEHERAPRE